MRDQAKKLWRNLYESGFQSIDIEKMLIDRIYDDIKSRTCANCTYNKSGVCYNSMVELMNSEKILVADEFGCNRWESRDD